MYCFKTGSISTSASTRMYNLDITALYRWVLSEHSRLLGELGWRTLSAWGRLTRSSTVRCSSSSRCFQQRAGLQRASSPAGFKAPRKAVVPGACPGGVGGAPCFRLSTAAHGAGTDGLPLLSCANLQARRLHSCLGNHWGVTVQSTEMGNTVFSH